MDLRKQGIRIVAAKMVLATRGFGQFLQSCVTLLLQFLAQRAVLGEIGDIRASGEHQIRRTGLCDQSRCSRARFPLRLATSPRSSYGPQKKLQAGILASSSKPPVWLRNCAAVSAPMRAAKLGDHGVRAQGFLYDSPLLQEVPMDLRKQGIRIVAAKMVEPSLAKLETSARVASTILAATIRIPCFLRSIGTSYGPQKTRNSNCCS
jgi:hypothetical protein